MQLRWQRFLSADRRQSAAAAADARRCIMCDDGAHIRDGIECAPLPAAVAAVAAPRRGWLFGRMLGLGGGRPRRAAGPPRQPGPRHFICRDCLEGYATHACTPGEGGGAVYGVGELFPPCKTGAAAYMGDAGGNCVCGPYRHKRLATLLSDAAFAAFERAREHWVQQEAVRAAAALAAAQAAAEAARSVVDRHVFHVTEAILTPRCPRCLQAFVDFEGCYALTCARNACAAKFCAWCLADCSADAHAHVMACAFNATQPRDYFASAQAFEEACRKRNARAIVTYLDGVAPRAGADRGALRAEVLARLRPTLQLHGLRDVK